MNLNLIKELGEQARLSIPENKFGVNEWVDQYNMNLARLIVQECVQLCEQGTATQTTSAGAAQMIQRHFEIDNDYKDLLREAWT